METNFSFFIQGSADTPYTLGLSLDPVSISCTCQAAITGHPCKHRLQIVNGQTENITGLTPASIEAISIFSEIIKKSDIPKCLEDYEKAKIDAKAKNDKSEKAFKKYRAAIVEHALNKGTEKAIKKASAELDAAMQDCVNAAAETESLIQALRTVFVFPF